MIKENPYENVCHKLYLLAYFPLYLVLSSCPMFPTSDMKRGEVPSLNRDNWFWMATKTALPWKLFEILHVEEKESALTPNVTFLCPSLASLLLFTYHPTTALPFLTFVSWLFFVEATELIFQCISVYRMSWRTEVHSEHSSPETKVLKLQIQKRNSDQLFLVCLRLS